MSAGDDPRHVVLVVAAFPWETAARVGLELARVGVTVDVAAPATSLARRVRAVRRHHVLPVVRRLPALRAAIESSGAELIVPCDDRARQALLELHARAEGSGAPALRAIIERSVGSPDHYDEIYSRARLMDVAAAEGLPCPATARVASGDDLAGWLGTHSLPAVLKTDGSWGGRGVVIATRAADAWSGWSRLRRRPDPATALKRLTLDGDGASMRTWLGGERPDVTVQEFVTGRPANLAAVARDGRLLGLVAVEVLASNGPLGPSTVVRVVERPEMRADMSEAARVVASRFGLSGLFGLDFVIDEATGRAVLLELNPRATPTCHLVTPDGTDLLGLLMGLLDADADADADGAVVSRPPLPDSPIALYPQLMRWEPTSPYLSCAHHDVPDGEPELVEAMLPLARRAGRRTARPVFR